MYTEIVRLLSAGALDDDAVREKAAEVDAAVTDPEDWLLDYDPEEIRQLVVEMTLGEFFLIGDKIDELHELISDEFAEPLPPFPIARIRKRCARRTISRGSTRNCSRGRPRGKWCRGTTVSTTICTSSSSADRIRTGCWRWPARWGCA